MMMTRIDAEKGGFLREMNDRLKNLVTRGKSLSARMACIEEGNAKIRRFISETEVGILRMESMSRTAEQSIGVLVSVLGKRKAAE